MIGEFTYVDGTVPTPDENYYGVIEKLALISERLKVAFLVPMTIMAQDLFLIDITTAILATGRLVYPLSVNQHYLSFFHRTVFKGGRGGRLTDDLNFQS